MKILKLTSISVLLVSIFACEPLVTFTEPQPVETKNLAHFPNRLQGQYRSVEDYSILLIDANLIQRIYDFDYKMHPNQLDSTFVLHGDTILDISTNERTVVKLDGDSLIVDFHSRDTLFQINNENVLRKMKGYYFLNTCLGKNNYEVKKMQWAKDQLTISSISTLAEIENLKALTESSQDTVSPYHFTLTKKQFKTFVKKEGFSEDERFIKQKF